MSYRVETAASGRAVCIGTDCKKAKIKIEKGELRLGVWVEFEEKGSYKWKHWGCVTGAQLQNMRERLADPQNPGYRWDMLDGYDGEEKNSLDNHPDLQEKVRRVITQGFIDPEDFNGDPEMNVLGAIGLRTPASKKKKREEEKKRAEEANGEENEEPPSPAKPASKKRVKDEDDDVKEKKPAKKKRTTKAKKEEDDDEESKPAKKSRAKKVKKEEEDQEMNEEKSKPIPVKKPRAKKVKKEEDADIIKNEEDQDESAVTAPKKKPAARKKAIKEEEADESNDAIGEPSESKVKAKRGRKKTVKEEPTEDTTLTADIESSAVAEGSTLPTNSSSNSVKDEPSDAVDAINAQITILKKLSFTDVSLPAKASPTQESVIPGIKDLDLQNMVAEGVESGAINDKSLVAFLQGKRDEVIAKLEKKKRGKKIVPSKSGRRSRTASKN